MVLSLVRWTATCVPLNRPNRYSRPICAPPSVPRPSARRSPKFPSPSGLVKRWVTRNALACFGIRSVVGRPTSVKSGSLGSTARSLGSACVAVVGVAVDWSEPVVCPAAVCAAPASTAITMITIRFMDASWCRERHLGSLVCCSRSSPPGHHEWANAVPGGPSRCGLIYRRDPARGLTSGEFSYASRKA